MRLCRWGQKSRRKQLADDGLSRMFGVSRRIAERTWNIRKESLSIESQRDSTSPCVTCGVTIRPFIFAFYPTFQLMCQSKMILCQNWLILIVRWTGSKYLALFFQISNMIMKRPMKDKCCPLQNAVHHISRFVFLVETFLPGRQLNNDKWIWQPLFVRAVLCCFCINFRQSFSHTVWYSASQKTSIKNWRF